jgi:tRNA pseudouridine13 synthase
VGDFEYVKEQAGLGALTGNRFEIVLRSLNKTKSEIALACKALEQSGFINYYGLQRFGKGGAKSHDVGRAIFKSDFKACVDMLFTVNAFDRDSFRTAKAHYHEGRLQKAVDVMPEHMYGEKQVLIKLLKNPADYAR